MRRLAPIISSVHIIVYSRQAEAVRAFFADVLGLKSVDAEAAGRSSPSHAPSLPCIRRTDPTVTNSS
jgi:hypothetical protein